MKKDDIFKFVFLLFSFFLFITGFYQIVRMIFLENYIVDEYISHSIASSACLVIGFFGIYKYLFDKK